MVELNYWDYGEVVKAFWDCNIKQNYEGFDFIKAFENFEGLIYRKVAEHGLLDYDDFKESYDGCFDYNCLEGLEQKTDYIQITKDDLIEAIMKYKYERNKETFSEGFSNLKALRDVYNKVQKAKCGELSQKENVFLFDEIIHTEHETGLIFEDEFDLEKLREEFERRRK